MAKGEIKIDVNTTQGKLMIVLIIAACSALWYFTVQMPKETRSKLWRRCAQIENKVDTNSKDIARLEGRHIE